MNDLADLVTIDSLTKSYTTDNGPILRDVSLRIKSGSTLAVVGPSGSGKSTLLNLLAGFDQPDSGRIYYRDLGDISSLTPQRRTEFRRKTIGFIFQRFNLLTDLTAAQNVIVALRLAGYSGQEAESKAYGALLSVGLVTEADRLPSQLSVGQMQRAAIARAIAKRPKLILADEPTGSVDVENKRAITELLLNLRRETGAAVVVATHDKEVSSACDAQYTLQSGMLALTDAQGNQA